MANGGVHMSALSRRSALGLAGAAASLAVIGSPVFSAAPALAADPYNKAGGWGNHCNGGIPLSALAAIPWNSVLYLRGDATKALIALNSAFKARFGRDLPVNSAYRSYADQVYWKNYWTQQGSPGNAATPGTSNHGWALAIDIGVGIADWKNPIYVWMKANAARYSWVHPPWAEPNGSTPEAWHWEYSGSYVPTPPPTSDEDNDMANVITVSVPEGSAQIWWSVNLGDNTKARIYNGVQLDFRRNIGIAEYVNQPPQTLQGYKDISGTA